ncbi:unnamed protein product [Camellia sinensis]
MVISFDHFRTIVNTQSQPVHRLIHSPLTAGNITITIMVMDSFSSTRITTPRFRCFDPATSTSSSSPSNSNSVVRRPLWELQALISVRLSPETMVTFSKMFLTCPTTSPTSLQYFVNEDDTVAQQIIVHKNSLGGTHFRPVGPRQKVYFESDKVHVSIVTCGGLCPGINTVIREIVCGLYYMYGVNKVLGIEMNAEATVRRQTYNPVVLKSPRVEIAPITQGAPERMLLAVPRVEPTKSWKDALLSPITQGAPERKLLAVSKVTSVTKKVTLLQKAESLRKITKDYVKASKQYATVRAIARTKSFLIQAKEANQFATTTFVAASTGATKNVMAQLLKRVEDSIKMVEFAQKKASAENMF